jgi:hypothetical protein
MSSSRFFLLSLFPSFTLWAIISIANAFSLASAASVPQLHVGTVQPARSPSWATLGSTSVQVQPAVTAPGSPILITSYSGLPPEQDGMVVKCRDCQETDPCAPGGTGAWAYGINGQFQCVDTTPPGMENILDFGAFPSLYRIGCSVQPGQLNIVCNGVANGDFNAGQDVVLYGAGVAPTVGQPAGFTALPVTTTGFAFSQGTRLAPGCTVQNAVAWCQSGSPVCGVSNVAFYEAGQTVSIEGAGPTGAPLTAQILGLDDGGNAIALSEAASTTVSGASVVGANCSTTRSYQAYPIDPNGGWGTPTSVLTVKNAASALNWGNFVDVQVNVPQPPMVSAAMPFYPLPNDIPIAWVFYCAEGNNPLNMCGIEVPTFSFLYNSPLPPPWNDSLLGGSNKGFPTVVTFHDVGRPYGHDLIQGTSLPQSAVNDMVFANITAINNDTVALKVTGDSQIAQSGTILMGHDNGPAVNRTAEVACNSQTGDCSTVYIPTMPNPFPVASPIVALRGTGLQVLGTGGPTTAEPGTSAGSELLWTGALGGTLLTLNQEMKPLIQNLSLQAYLGTTMGVTIDADEWDPGDGLGVSVTTTRPTLQNIYTGQSSVGARFANKNPSNVEFGVVSDSIINFVYGDSFVSASGIGILLNSSNALGTVLNSSTVSGEIGVWNNLAGFLFSGGQMGAADEIGVWIASGYSHPITINTVRNEHLARFVYSPNIGSTGAGVLLTITQSTLTDIRVPIDGAFISLTGADSTQLQNNEFYMAGRGVNSDYSTNLYPQGIVFPGQLAPFFAQGNFWSANCDDPYGELRSSNIPVNASGETCDGPTGQTQFVPLYATGPSTSTMTPSATPSISPTAVPTTTETPSPTPTIVAGRLVVSPAHLMFPTEVFGNEAGTSSAPRNVTLANRGLVSISLFGTSLTGGAASDFRVQPSGSTCGQTLAPKQRCIYKIAFQPTAVGIRETVLNISDNLPNSPQSILLSGRAKP